MAVNDFTGKNIQDTYQRVVQTDGTKLADGTGSLLPITFDGQNVIITGSLIANEYIVSSSVTNVVFQQQSGSTIFGDSSDDTHQFTGSLDISGSVAIFPESATQAAVINAIKDGTYSLFVGSGSSNTQALIYSDTGHASLQLRSNTNANAQIAFNEDGSSRYIMGHYGSDDSFQIRNSSFMTGGDQLFKLEFDGSGITLGHDLGFHVTASGNIRFEVIA